MRHLLVTVIVVALIIHPVWPHTHSASERRYLLYNVNPGEGFNLRRDVYMRVATLARALDVVLVLPPWPTTLYHWTVADQSSPGSSRPDHLPWATFFHLPSLNAYTPVIEFQQYVDEQIATGSSGDTPRIDRVFYLQNFADAFAEGVKWVEKVEREPCHEEGVLDSYLEGVLFNNAHVTITNATCLSAQGSAVRIMKPFLTQHVLSDAGVRSVMLDRAEVLLHDGYGLTEYWRVRRSMRFARHLVDAADRFRLQYLNSSDAADGTLVLEDWRQQEYQHGDARGGPYLSVHLRRRDYLYSHAQEIPSIEGAATQILSLLDKLSLDAVFLATDAESSEVTRLSSIIAAAGKRLITFISMEMRGLLPGEAAIIDQWIASHAAYFIGSHVSTFSYRIQEEREIQGFRAETTFNRLCPDRVVQSGSEGEGSGCEQPSKWMVVYRDEEYWQRLRVGATSTSDRDRGEL